MIVYMEDLLFLQIKEIDIDKSDRILNFKHFVFRDGFLEYFIKFSPLATTC
jgi:hypothetical protein